MDPIPNLCNGYPTKGSMNEKSFKKYVRIQNTAHSIEIITSLLNIFVDKMHI
jgi:hypothetical protein